MFGYVRILKPELKMSEYEQYEGVYCALCKQLGRRYGLLARFTLSYDFTFLALFRMAMDDRCPQFKKERCTFNPLKKCTFCGESEHLAASADAAAILVYYKIKDTLADDGFWASLPARLAYPFAALMRRRAKKRCPALEEQVRDCMADQAAVERAGEASIDRAADPFARLLSALAAQTAGGDSERRVLERFGYCLGRWIYLVDAVDDMEEDREKNRYNPYLLSMEIEDGETAAEAVRRRQEYAFLTLNACLAECISAYELLDIHRFDGILRNILELGMPAVQRQVSASAQQKGMESL